MSEARDLLFSLLRAAIAENSTNTLKTDTVTAHFRQLYRLAYQHDVAHLVCEALDAAGVLEKNEPVADAFCRQRLAAVFRYEQQQQALLELSAALEQAKIDFLPLKGAVIRALYPAPWMRTSCDIDVLVRESDLSRAITCLVERCGYEKKQQTHHDVLLVTAGGVHIELHHTLIEEDYAQSAGEALARVWETAAPAAAGSRCHLMSPELFYAYHVAHMAKHIERGGCGIRPFLDLYLLRQQNNIEENRLQALLREMGLLKFANAAEQLAAHWFADTTTTAPVVRALEAYVLDGGLYGTAEQNIAANGVKKGGKLRHFLSLVFLPLKDLKCIYPVLEKHPWLMPVCQVRRWLRSLLRGGVGRFFKTLRRSKSVDAAQTDKTAALFQALGL